MFKRFIIFYICIFCINNSYSQNICNIKNEDFIFSYKISENNFSYEIIKKNKESFIYYEPFFRMEKHIPTEISLILGDNKNLNNLVGDDLKAKFKDFYHPNDNVYNFNYLTSLQYDFIFDYNNFEKIKILKNSIDINYLILDNYNIFNNKYLINNQKIHLEIKVILDPQLKECLIFTTEPINYNFANFAFFLKKTKYHYNQVAEFFELNLKAIK